MITENKWSHGVAISATKSYIINNIWTALNQFVLFLLILNKNENKNKYENKNENMKIVFLFCETILVQNPH